MTTNSEIIDKTRNPFTRGVWVKQRYSLTPARMTQLQPLFEKSIENIEALPENDGKYVAFVAIRWGFARIQNSKLAPTEKWEHKGDFDGKGLKKHQ